MNQKRTNEQIAIQVCLRILSGVTRLSDSKYIMPGKFSDNVNERHGKILGAAKMAIPFTEGWVDDNLKEITSAAFSLLHEDI
jgi:hypothetical protein